MATSAEELINNLSPAECERLLEIAGAAQGFIRHDISNDGSMANYFLLNIQMYFDGKITAKELRKYKALSPHVQANVSNLYHVTKTHLIGRDVRWSLASSLSYISGEVISELKERNVSVLPSRGPSVFVLFPQNALYSIALEFARNAAVHAPGSEVALEWSIQSKNLILSVHDGGKTLTPLLPDKFIALELAQPEVFKKGGGLSIIRRIAHHSGGLLLARRSKVLGGAEFSIRLPISGYIEEVGE